MEEVVNELMNDEVSEIVEVGRRRDDIEKELNVAIL